VGDKLSLLGLEPGLGLGLELELELELGLGLGLGLRWESVAVLPFRLPVSPGARKFQDNEDV